MILSLIAAMTPSRVIGVNNTLPWKMPKDLAHFRKLTQHKIVIMGRKTFDSIGKALPNRRNIVITRDTNFTAPNIEVFHSLESAIALLKSDESEIFVIGGAQIYTQALLLANRLYITYVDADVNGDAYFPGWNKEEWVEVSNENHLKDPENPYNYRFVLYERK